MQSGYREDAVSRAYYAILHAAKAALFVHDVAVASHASVRRMFGLHLVRSRKIRARVGGLSCRGFGCSAGCRLQRARALHQRRNPVRMPPGAGIRGAHRALFVGQRIDGRGARAGNKCGLRRLPSATRIYQLRCHASHADPHRHFRERSRPPQHRTARHRPAHGEVRTALSAGRSARRKPSGPMPSTRTAGLTFWHEDDGTVVLHGRFPPEMGARILERARCGDSRVCRGADRRRSGTTRARRRRKSRVGRRGRGRARPVRRP